MRVKAISVGYYNSSLVNPGDIFELNNEKDYSKNWMEKIEDSTAVVPCEDVLAIETNDIQDSESEDDSKSKNKNKGNLK